MNKPWWIWEGAAVRVFGYKAIAKVLLLESKSAFVEGAQDMEEDVSYNQITPIENPAVMLAYEEATHAAISPGGEVFYTIGLNKRFLHGVFIWKECPDNLKGHTWELPK